MKNRITLYIIGLFFPILLSAQWISQATGFDTANRGLWDISIANENTVWAMAYDGNLGVFETLPEFTRTVDGGAHWIPGILPSGYLWSNIMAINADTAWVTGVSDLMAVDGAVFKTTDGGITWNEQGTDEIFNSTSYCNFVYFWNENDGVAVGDPNSSEFEIYTSSDGGNTWMLTPASAIPNPENNEYGIFRNYCTYGDHIWFGTNKARVYHSTDKGLTWTVGDTDIPTTNITDHIDIVFWSENDGLARKYNSSSNTNVKVVRTSDGGSTWEPHKYAGTIYGSIYGGIAYIPGTSATLVSTGAGTVSGSSYSDDGGINWVQIDTNVQHYITRFFNPSTGWSAGFNTDNTTGGIYKYAGPVISGVNSENRKEVKFNTYPNPSNGKLVVNLMQGEQDNLLLTVIDLDGRTVFKQDYGHPGAFFSRSLDLEYLASGVYLLKLENGSILYLERIVIR